MLSYVNSRRRTVMMPKAIGMMLYTMPIEIPDMVRVKRYSMVDRTSIVP